MLCGLPPSLKTTLADSCRSAGGDAAAAALDAARGEVEAVQVLLDNAGGAALPAAALSLTWDAGAPPAGVAALAPALVSYVHTEASPRYAASATGWFADALLPWPAAGAPLAAGGQLTAWLSFNVSARAAPGVYTGVLAVAGSGQRLPLRLTVWAATLPPLAQSAFKTAYAFDEGPAMRVYGAAADRNRTIRAYFDALAALRFPATNIYADAPLPLWQYEYLGAQGAPILILADISSLPFSDAPAPPRRRALAGGSGHRQLPAACPSFSQSYISAMVALLQPTWDALGALGLQDRATVYGFDEIDASCEPVVRQLFAAAKAAFPGVRTLSAIDWPTVPLDLPLDVWVLQYQLVNRTVTDAWIAAGHELYTYHCIEPSGANFLNTFNEVPLIAARLLFWYDFILNVSGHLYYEVALYVPWTIESPLPPTWAQYTQSGVSFAATAAPIASRPEDVRLSTWDPANFIWAPRTDIWANGDGLFMYPGALNGSVGTPVSTVRFEAQRDGVEDWLLFNLIKDRAAVLALVNTQVSAPTVWSQNTTALASVRRSLLAMASAA